MSCNQLDYAPTQPKSRKWIFCGIALLTVLIMTFCGWRWGPFAWHQAKTLYRQRQCLNYTAPPDQVIYEEEPIAAAKLLARDANYSPYPINRSNPKDATKAVTAAAYSPPCWRAFSPAFTPMLLGAAPATPRAIVFLHELKSPAGHRRLVCVQLFPDPTTFSPQFVEGFDYDTTMFHPAGINSQAALISHGWSFDIESTYPVQPVQQRVYAGQVDPNDPSHFTIRYQMWGQEDILDGRLGDDDRVILTQRHMPQWR